MVIMKYIIPIILFALTTVATPITEQYMLILIQKDVSIQERRIYIDNMNAMFSDVTTNEDMSVTTNYFIKFLDTDNNAQGAFTQEPDVTKHQKIEDKFGKQWNPYLWYSSQVSPKLSKEVLRATEDAIGKNKINIFYPNEDFSAWMAKNNYTYVTNGVNP